MPHSLAGSVTNDTVIADPLFTVPILGGGQLCYEVHGQPGYVFNLVSDKCTSVSADYEPMDIPENANIIRAIGVKAVGTSSTCHNIEVHLVSGSEHITALVDNVQVTGTTQVNGIRVRRFSDWVCISVPNCEYLDLVMWMMYQERGDQRMLMFVITRGYNLAPTSHGLVGELECNEHVATCITVICSQRSGKSYLLSLFFSYYHRSVLEYSCHC